MRFRDRVQAGRLLAERLKRYELEAPIVLGLARGGVPVAREVARVLHAPLEVWVARKLGAPSRPELGLGAVSEGGAVYVDPELVSELEVTEEELERLVEQETRELERRVQLFRAGRPPPVLTRRTVVLVDDGIATGGTVRATLRALRAQNPSRIVIAVPVAAWSTADALSAEVNEVVALSMPQTLWAIGAWYDDFTQVRSEEVLEILAQEGGRERGAASAVPSA